MVRARKKPEQAFSTEVLLIVNPASVFSNYLVRAALHVLLIWTK